MQLKPGEIVELLLYEGSSNPEAKDIFDYFTSYKKSGEPVAIALKLKIADVSMQSSPDFTKREVVYNVAMRGELL